MMLDMKRTFDEVVEAHAEPDAGRVDPRRTRSTNPCPPAFAGTQEYMAMEKLGQLASEAERDGTWDLIVVDTPPSRSALDFLDAPERLGSFLDGRFIRILVAPAKAGGRAYLRAVSAGLRGGHAVLDRIVGAAAPARTSRPSSRRSTRCSAASASGPSDLRAAAGPGDRVPRRGGARAGRAARGLRTSSSGSPPSACRWPGWCSTGCTGRAARRADRGAGAGGRRAAGADRRTTLRPGSCGCTPSRDRVAHGAAPALAALHRGAPAGAGAWRCRRGPRTCTTSTACGGSARRSRRAEPDRAQVVRRELAVRGRRACARTRRGRSRAAGATT